MAVDIRWPDFFVVGAMRSGTTSIYNYLRNHPKIFVTVPKEPHFFACDACRNRRALISSAIDDESRYLKSYEKARADQLVGDFSVSNLWCESAARRIFDKAPHAKIIIVLRNPIERAFSHYLLRVDQESETRTVAEAINSEISDEGGDGCYLDIGNYASQIRRYLEVFPPDRISIRLYDDLARSKERFIAETLDFLELPGEIRREDMNFRANAGGMVRGGAFSLVYRNRRYFMPVLQKLMPKATRANIRDRLFVTKPPGLAIGDRERELLRSYYENDISETARLIGKDLSGWLSPAA
jgi:hypothetical protein